MEMYERVTPTGFEKFFIESWEGWDALDVSSFIFYKAKMTGVFGLPTDKLYDVAIELDKLVVEVYDVMEGEGQPTVVATRNFELKLTD